MKTKTDAFTYLYPQFFQMASCAMLQVTPAAVTLSVAIGGGLSLVTGFERHTPARLGAKLPHDLSHRLIGSKASSKSVSHHKLNVLHLNVTQGFVSPDINPHRQQRHGVELILLREV
jgi:hypothetical protein